MFDPIKASKEIKDSYIDYITTTFDMADTDYEREFRKELQTDGMVASGPFLDIGGSYETGHTLRELIQAQKASILFESFTNQQYGRTLFTFNETQKINATLHHESKINTTDDIAIIFLFCSFLILLC